MDKSELIDLAIEYIPRGGEMWILGDQELVCFQWYRGRELYKLIITDNYTHFKIIEKPPKTPLKSDVILDICKDRETGEALLDHVQLWYIGLLFKRKSLDFEEAAV